MSGSSLVPEPMSAEQVSVNVSTAAHQSAKSLGSSRRTVDVVPTFTCRFLLDGALGTCAKGVSRRIGPDKRPSTPESHWPQLGMIQAKRFLPDQSETRQSRLLELGLNMVCCFGKIGWILRLVNCLIYCLFFVPTVG